MWHVVHSCYRLTIALFATVIAGLTAGALLAQGNPPAAGADAQDEPIKRTVLFRGDLEGVPGKEIVVFIADLAPGAAGGKHYHPGPEFFYVLEGTLAHEPEGGPAHMLKTGTFSLNPDKAIHLVRNPDATVRTRAIDFLITDKGQPIVVPVK